MITLKQFQQNAAESAVRVFQFMRSVLDTAGTNQDAIATAVHDNGYILLEAPTGSGKTLIAGNIVQHVCHDDKVVWLWFAPFKGVVDQSIAFLRQQFPGLRLRSLTSDRNPIGTRSGDVFVTTWQLVATRVKDRRSARTTGELNSSIDDMILELRQQGFRVGVVIDEAHHTFKGDNQAAVFYRTVLRPEYTILVTATPNDRDLIELKERMQIRNIHRICINREDVAGAGQSEGLIKRGVKAVAWRLEQGSEAVVDFEKTALRNATELHRVQKSLLTKVGISLTPLMLVQVDSRGPSVDRARESLLEFGFREDQIAVHTAKEPDENLLSLANNEKIEVLIFKMAVALGFDAPRAWTLVSMRTTRNEDFGIQLIGRVLRVHRRLQGKTVPDPLRYGYVLLADIETQGGLDRAGQRINQMRTSFATVSPTTMIYANGGEMLVQSAEDGNQLQLMPTPPLGAHFLVPLETNDLSSISNDEEQFTLFSDSEVFSGTRRSVNTILGTPPPVIEGFAYPLREGVPRVFYTEEIAPDDLVTEEEVAAFFKVNIDTLYSAMNADSLVAVERRTVEVFSRQIQIQLDFAPPSLAEKSIAAQQCLFKFRTLNPKLLRNRLVEAVLSLMIDVGIKEASVSSARLALDDILCFHPHLLSDAVKRAMASKSAVALAEPLPDTIHSTVALESSRLNVYTVFPPLNTWERHFAGDLDSDESNTVLWWHRNEPRKPWSINVLMENGQNFYPDFIIGIRNRAVADNGLLADTKEAYARVSELPKLLAKHRVYGRVLVLSKNNPSRRWEIVSWDSANFRPRVEGQFFIRKASSY